MNKQQAIKIFGSSSKLALALGIRPQAVSQWPEALTQRKVDEITGAALRLGLLKPKRRAA